MTMIRATAEETRLRQKRWTQAEFHELPEGPPFYELEDGQLIEMPPPRLGHQKILTKLLIVISHYLEQHPIGEIWPEVEVDINATRIFVPDLSFLSSEHLDKIEDDLRIIAAPDLVVEIASPSTASRDRTIKLQTYQQADVPWCWLVEADSAITEYKLTPDGYLLHRAVAPGNPFSPGVFPGLTFNLAELMGERPATQEADEQQ